ncbi:Methylaspartate ammonia-lyase [Baekduia alba]|uniref:methylaspartate ammonia-lyase n=1 Tax=Baekduia alba TaxID=2997333 RepID=UPI002341B04D|nr:methylaspartate ammonia-lyase [Baekduia alba]WCB95148.1 Methylaspartate ammonia-lyase [Baekduia alba]
MRIDDVLCFAGLGAFPNDDQAAIRAGAGRDGHFYTGVPVTGGYRRVRQASQALCVVLVLEDGTTVGGDGVSVQYAGAAGRDPVLDAEAAATTFGPVLRDAFAGGDAASFRASSARLDALELPLAVRYGASQALLAAAAAAGRRTIAETVAAEYATGAPLRAVPLFAQCGESRRDGVDHMILREVDELPHGLINHAPTLVGPDGRVLAEYVRWIRDRILDHRASSEYSPTLHIDTYGTIGETFGAGDACAAFLAELGRLAAPFTLRIEQPVHAASRVEQIAVLAQLRGRLRAAGSTVQLVADEWCNTLEDVEAFIAGDAADMLQVKLPDVGGLDASIRALIACKEAGVLAYCGGSCTETERAARIAAGVAMGVGADLLLARPGMGIDEAVMVTRNEMRRTLALVGARSAAR